MSHIFEATLLHELSKEERVLACILINIVQNTLLETFV